MLSKDIHIKLSDIMDKHYIAMQNLIELTGYAKTTVYDFMTGKHQSLDVGLAILNALYELTGDQKLLTTGRRNVIVIDLPAIETADVSFKTVSEQTREFADMLKDLSDIYEDGVVDARDRKSIEWFNRHADNLVAKIQETKYAINKKLEKANQTS